MRILITNDDGINAPGLKVLHDIATEIAGPRGEVWTVAPAFEQSGVAHKISFTHPMMIAQLGERRFAAEGSPADCVLAGLHDVLTDTPPDLVLSGINRGNNAGENAMYSGTLGGAMEAALQGLPAIALSQYLGPENFAGELQFQAAAAHGAATVRALGRRGLPPVLQRQFPAPARRPGQGAAGLRAGIPARRLFRGGTAHVARGAQVPVDQGRPATDPHRAGHRRGREPVGLHHRDTDARRPDGP